MADETLDNGEPEQLETTDEGALASTETATGDVPIPAADETGDPATTMHWYIVHAYSGFENKVAESLRGRAQAFGFASRVGQILIPTEEVIELRNGKKVTSKRLLYPGYVLVEMEMDDDTWHVVRSTPRVTGFVGSGQTPSPLSEPSYRQRPVRPKAERIRLSRERGASPVANCGPGCGIGKAPAPEASWARLSNT